MELSILERIVLQGLLPQESDFVTFRIIRELKNELSFTEDEFKKFKITQDNSQIKWNSEGQKHLKKVEIGEKATSIIVDAFKKLNEAGKINEDNYLLYEKFIN